MIVERACQPWEVPFFACRGYVSQSEMYYASKRLLNKHNAGKEIYIFHIGDHDPSGLDMTRDMRERSELFMNCKIHFRRLALNLNQVHKLNLPPNPAKIKDSRFPDYKKKFGNNSWELDALKPKFIVDLIQPEIKKLVNEQIWDSSVRRDQAGRW